MNYVGIYVSMKFILDLYILCGTVVSLEFIDLPSTYSIMPLYDTNITLICFISSIWFFFIICVLLIPFPETNFGDIAWSYALWLGISVDSVYCRILDGVYVENQVNQKILKLFYIQQFYWMPPSYNHWLNPKWHNKVVSNFLPSLFLLSRIA